MATSLTNFKAEFEQLLLQFLWRQWSALGVSGYSESKDPWCIDPEALLLFSTVIARKDPRLFDEIFDWLHQNASWLSLQRINHMRKTYPGLGDRNVLAALASHLSQQSEHRKWGSLCNQGFTKQRNFEPPTGQPVPLFQDLPHYGESDPHFRTWGYLRPPVEHRGLSTAPRCNRPATFLFKLRSLFGRQARAEVMAWLLANPSGHPAEIARQTGHFARSAQIVLNELELSGHIQSKRIGREKHFFLRHIEWDFLLQKKPNEMATLPKFPQWILWPEIFATLQSFAQLMDAPKLATMSESLQAIQIKKALEQIATTRVGLQSEFAPDLQATGAEFLDATLEQLSQLLG